MCKFYPHGVVGAENIFYGVLDTNYDDSPQFPDTLLAACFTNWHHDSYGFVPKQKGAKIK